jgi:hypothetical protein
MMLVVQFDDSGSERRKQFFLQGQGVDSYNAKDIRNFLQFYMLPMYRIHNGQSRGYKRTDVPNHPHDGGFSPLEKEMVGRNWPYLNDFSPKNNVVSLVQFGPHTSHFRLCVMFIQLVGESCMCWFAIDMCMFGGQCLIAIWVTLVHALMFVYGTLFAAWILTGLDLVNGWLQRFRDTFCGPHPNMTEDHPVAIAHQGFIWLYGCAMPRGWSFVDLHMWCRYILATVGHIRDSTWNGDDHPCRNHVGPWSPPNWVYRVASHLATMSQLFAQRRILIVGKTSPLAALKPVRLSYVVSQVCRSAWWSQLCRSACSINCSLSLTLFN